MCVDVKKSRCKRKPTNWWKVWRDMDAPATWAPLARTSRVDGGQGHICSPVKSVNLPRIVPYNTKVDEAVVSWSKLRGNVSVRKSPAKCPDNDTKPRSKDRCTSPYTTEYVARTVEENNTMASTYPTTVDDSSIEVRPNYPDTTTVRDHRRNVRVGESNPRSRVNPNNYTAAVAPGKYTKNAE